MREILFRGKRKDSGEWIEGSLQKYTREKPNGVETHYNISEYNYGYADNDGFEPTYTSGFDDEVIPKTVGQFTGLTDKNGKKIFEGDICKNTKTGEIVVVKWHGTMAGFVWSKRKEKSNLFDFGELFRAHDKYEVIGNIHDNPELVKEEK